ncbi:MAG: YggT family protein [Gemmatimonadota bacterium]|nr:MAG: YggT family protein [Gemmatimonadota bacterium]
MAYFIVKLLNVYIIVILIRVVLSWVRPNPYNPFVQVIYKLTEPVLAPIRRIVPPFGGTIDVSPIILFIIIYVIISILV